MQKFVTTKLIFILLTFIQSYLSAEIRNAGDVEKPYRPPAYGSGPNEGHKTDPQKRKFVSSKEILSYRKP